MKKTLKNFIDMAKTNLVTKNINAVNVSTNSLRIVPKLGLAGPPAENIRSVLGVIKLRFYITTTIFILITVAVTRNVTIQCLYQNQLLYQLLQCLNCLEKLTLSVCVTLFMLF